MSSDLKNSPMPDHWRVSHQAFAFTCLAAFGQPNPMLIWASMDSDWEGFKQGVLERLKNASIVVSATKVWLTLEVLVVGRRLGCCS
jgi:hypothetical protein